MKPRRSRFNRIYRRLTRRAPNRQAQWRQISALRAPGAPGYPARQTCRRVYVPDELVEEASFEPGAIFQPSEPDVAEPRNRARVEPEAGHGGGAAAVAALIASLFLLACAYAAFSGYMHSYDEGFAYLGILGAVGSLLAAGIGICLAASGLRRRYSGKFLSACAISLATLYGMLLFFAVGR